MFDKLKNFYKNIKNLNHTVDNYKSDSIIQSLPTKAYVNKAKKMIEDKDYASATEVLKSALDISDRDYLVYKYLGKIAEIQKKFNDACKYYEKSSELNPNDKEIWLRLGMSYLYHDMPSEAILSFEKADKITPFNTDIQTGWGMALMKLKKYSLAKDKFNLAARISKYNFSAILLSAVMEIRLEEYAIAEEKLKFLVKVAPNEGSLYEYAHLKLIQGKYEEAETYAKKTLQINKQMLPAYFLLGEIYSVNRDCEKTDFTFDTALYNDLDSPVLHFEHGKCYVRLLDFVKAKEEFEKSLSMDSNYTDAKIGMALMKAYNNDFALLDELKEKNMDNVYIKEACGFEKMYEQNYDAAAELFKSAVKKDPNQTYNNFNLALVYAKLNQQYKAREYFEKFTNQNPEYINGLVEYSKWLISISDHDEAQRKLKKALKYDENNSEILNLLFSTQFALVKKNICEYNIVEAISIAHKALETGEFNYAPQLQELEDMLKNYQESRIY